MHAIVLTWDRNRAMTEHMMLQYAKLWPDHPFVFHIPYQALRGDESDRVRYIKAPPAIRATVLQLINGADDEEWIYWCMDDRYPIQLKTEEISRLMAHATGSRKMSGLLFCRCRALLNYPKTTLFPAKYRGHAGQIYRERRGWHQIWIHQFLKIKVLRHLFSHLPAELPNANAMDKLKHEVPKLREHRLFVTRENFAVFGESTRRGAITQNCYESAMRAGLTLPEWFQQPNGERVILGRL